MRSTPEKEPLARVLACDHRHYPGQVGLEYVAAWYEADDARRRYEAHAEEQASLGVRPDRDGAYPGIELIFERAAWRTAHRASARMRDHTDPAEEAVHDLLMANGIRALARYEGVQEDPEGRIPNNYPPRPLHRYVLELHREGEPRAEVEFWSTEAEHRYLVDTATIPAALGLLRVLAQANEVYDHEWSEEAWGRWRLSVRHRLSRRDVEMVRDWWTQVSTSTRTLRSFFGSAENFARWRALYEPPF